MGGLFAEGALWWALAVLALYGGVVASVHLWRIIRGASWPRGPADIHLIAVVHNQEQQVEGLVRSLAGMTALGQVVVVDAGSNDQTPLIVERLCRKNEVLRLVRTGGRSPWEAGLTASGSKVAILVDARGAANLLCLLEAVQRLLGTPSVAASNGRKRET